MFGTTICCNPDRFHRFHFRSSGNHLNFGLHLGSLEETRYVFVGVLHHKRYSAETSLGCSNAVEGGEDDDAAMVLLVMTVRKTVDDDAALFVFDHATMMLAAF